MHRSSFNYLFNISNRHNKIKILILNESAMGVYTNIKKYTNKEKM